MAKAGKSIYKLWAIIESADQDKPISSYAQLLYHRLTIICNRHMWVDEFPASNAELMAGMRLKSEHTLIRVRAELIDRGLIKYTAGSLKGAPSKYTLPTDLKTVEPTASKSVQKRKPTASQTVVEKLATDLKTVESEVPTDLKTAECVKPTDLNAVVVPGNPLPVSDTDDPILNNTYNNTINNTLYPENSFSGTPEKAKKVRQKKGQKPPANPAYALIIEHWLKVVHPGWTFNNIHGIKVKSIISQLERRLLNDGLPAAPENVVASFKLICENLPDWYKDKDLPIIDSKLNEITEHVKNKTNGTEQKPAGRPGDVVGSSKYAR